MRVAANFCSPSSEGSGELLFAVGGLETAATH
jgi:hypothetical protein